MRRNKANTQEVTPPSSIGDDSHQQFMSSQLTGIVSVRSCFIRLDTFVAKVSLVNLCIYQNVMYSSLLENLKASDMVRSDHDSYVHDGGGLTTLCC